MKKGDYIVIGMSNLGRSIANKLNQKGIDVIAIDKNNDQYDFMENFSGFMVTSDATDIAVLEANNIRNAHTVVITTDNDNTNIFIAHVCSKVFNVPEIICRVADKEKNILLDDNIKIINPFSLCMDYFDRIIEE